MRFYKHLMFNYPWFSKHLTCIKIFDFYSHLLKLIGIMINFKDEKKKVQRAETTCQGSHR